eukprot:CAMPEP_0176471372 /NCGR_PEP_ID=MMETSP0127-20121128/41094_1 /TAXON_ID=938130 /ORGANISM="Platyophrya macrostoma, Strain WH" /LENGTH=66 /DNA_ID=CAMNT_0017866009 /DNA_START=606 /DNA_END=806 /DNA_ORIENTATION=-
MDYGYDFIEKDGWTYKELVEWFLPKFVFSRLKKYSIKLWEKITKAKEGVQSIKKKKKKARVNTEDE